MIRGSSLAREGDLDAALIDFKALLNVSSGLFGNDMLNSIAKINIASKKGIRISLDARIPATTITKAARLKSTCCTWLGPVFETFPMSKLRIK